MFKGVKQMATQKQREAKETLKQRLLCVGLFDSSTAIVLQMLPYFASIWDVFALLSCHGFQMAAGDAIFRIEAAGAGSSAGFLRRFQSLLGVPLTTIELQRETAFYTPLLTFLLPTSSPSPN